MEDSCVFKHFGGGDDDDDDTIQLKEPINLHDLTLTDGKGGVNFEVDPRCQSKELPEYHQEYVHKDLPMEALGFDDDDPSMSENENNESPFEKLAKTMENIKEDGGVKKKILTPGIGDVVPLNKQVTIHYSASLEYSDEPFDSTQLRNKPLKYVIGCGEMIEGLECGIATMKVKEESLFLVSPEYAFGKRGVPPRIPENATILFRVVLIKWDEATEVYRYFHMPYEDRRVCEFPLLKTVAEHFLQEGKAKYQQNKYVPASKQFIQGIRAIEEYRPANEEVENEYHKLLIRLCQNACVINMKLNNFGAVKYYADKALAIDPNLVKALFYKGKAQSKCGDFDFAVRNLKKALALEPKNRTVVAELEAVNKYKAAMEFSYSDMCHKMFGGVAKKSEGDRAGKSHDGNGQEYQSKPSDKLVASLTCRLNVFVNSDIMELPLQSSTLTQVERDLIKKFCQENELEYVEKGEGSNLHIRLCKKRPDTALYQETVGPENLNDGD